MEGIVMYRRSMFAALVMALMLVVPSCSAYLDMDIEESEKTAYLGDEVSFDLSITNNRALIDNLMVEILGEPHEWVSAYPAFLQIPGRGGVSEFSVVFFPSGETPGDFMYTVMVSSESGVSVSRELMIEVMRPLDIEEFTVTNDDGELSLNMLMSSKDKRDAELTFAILNSRAERLQTFSLDAVVDGSTMVQHVVQLPEGMLAGDYNVQVSLVGTPVKKEYMFTVMPIHKVTETVKKTSTTFYDEFEVTITNEGNIAEPSYVTYRTLPNNDWVTGLITKPEECVIRDGMKTCRYEITGLAIGESATMSYRLDYTSIYATYALILIAILSLVVYGIRRSTAPVISKRHVRKSGGRHHVVIEIKNPYLHNLSNAIVRDWVSPLANVIHHEIDAVKPLIRRSDAGTELIWKLGDIGPKETRIITYPIKALVHGSLKMPKAYIRYNRPSGRLKRLFSRTLIINT